MQRYVRLLATIAFFMQTGVAEARQAAAAGDAQPANACSFQPPAPLLLPNTYAGQSQERQRDNLITEKAHLSNGLRIEIQQSACVDFVTTEFVLIIPREPGRELDQKAQIRLARATIAGLKTARPARENAELLDFLNRAPGLRSHAGSLGSCRDGSEARPGECSWESMGGFIFSVKRTERGTRISVTQYLSA
jgi:hypothetical protein